MKPFSERKYNWMFALCMAFCAPLQMNTGESSTLVFQNYGLFFCTYFVFITQINEQIDWASHKEKPKQTLCLQFYNQDKVFIQGVILQSILLMVAYILVELITCLVTGIPMGIFLTCAWLTIGSSIISVFYVFSSMHKHSQYRDVFVFVCFFIMALFVFTRPFGMVLHIPAFFGSVQGIIRCVGIWVFSLPIMYMYGRYCYRTRNDGENEKGRVMRR